MHSDDVLRVERRVQHFHETKTPFRLNHGISFTTRSIQKQAGRTVDVSSMKRVLEFSPPDANPPTSVKVEPNVGMGPLVDACLERGVIPPVVMEIPEITTGGGFAGTSGETSSFRQGLFYENVNAVDVVLANGQFKHVDRLTDPDLFYALANSYGTMGVLVALYLRLIKASEFVKVRYEPVKSVQEAIAKFEAAKAEDPEVTDFLEGVMFSKNNGMVCRSSYASASDVRDLPRQTFSRPSDPWYYLHIEEQLHRANATTKKSSLPHADAVPLREYLFRWDRGGFWMGKYAFDYFLTPFNALTRYLLDRLMKTRVALKAFQSSTLNDQFVIQDVGVPLFAAPNLINWLDKNWGHYPILLCPVTNTGRAPLFAQWVPQGGMCVNFGVYGPGPKDVAPTDARGFLDFNIRFEREVRSYPGMKCLYAQVFCDEAEWSGIYDMKKYRAARKSVGADYLPDIWQKMRAGSFQGNGFWLAWPLPGIFGVYTVVMGKILSLLAGIPGL